MKRALRISRTVLLSMLIVIYIAVALCNLSIIQSYMGAAASRYFSKEWGGTVRIASLHATPLGHIKLRNILLVSPNNDTIFDGDVIDCNFDHFPLTDDGLSFSRIRISNAYYHMSTDSNGINIKYIINYFAKPDQTEDTIPSKPFAISVKRVILSNIHYKHDLAHQSRYYANQTHSVNVSHMEYRHIYGNFKNLHIENSHINCRIVHLECEEQTGFRLQDMSADVNVSPQGISTRNMELTTDNTHMRCDIILDYDSWRAFSGSNIFDSVHFSVTLHKGTTIGLLDAAYWAPGLWGMDNTVSIAGSVDGPLSYLQIDEMEVAFGNQTQLRYKGSLVGLPHIEQTEFNLDVQAPCISSNDIVAFHQPEKPFFTIPKPIREMGNVSVDALLRGSLKKGDINLSIDSDFGSATAQASVAYDKRPRDLHYSLQFQSNLLRLAKLTQDNRLATTAVQLNLNGKGTNLAELVLESNITLHNTTLMQHHLASSNVQLQLDHRHFSVQGEIDDPLVALHLNGSGMLAGDSSRYQGRLSLNNGQLSKLFGSSDSSHAITVTTTADIDLQGIDLEHLRGNIALHDNQLTIGNNSRTVDNITITLDENNHYKTLQLQSDIVQVTLNGYLDYKRIPQLSQLFLQRYLSSDIIEETLDSDDIAVLATQSFNTDLVWNDPNKILNLILPNLHISPGTQLHGSYNHTESMKLVARSDSIRIGSLKIHDLALSCHQLGENYTASCDIERVDLSGLSLFTNLLITSSNNNKSSKLRLRWDDNENNIRNQGDIGFIVHHNDGGQHQIQVTDPTFYVRGQRWNITCDDILLTHQSFLIPHLSIHNDIGAITAKASATADGVASASIDFNNFSIDMIDSLILSNKHITIEGIINGNIHANRTTSTMAPYLLANLSVNNCAINNQSLGDISIQSSLDMECQKLNINAFSKLHNNDSTRQPITATGYITLNEKPQINLDVNLDNFALATTAPLLSSFASNVDGTLSANIHIDSSLNQPKIEGIAHIHNGLLTVDYTGVTYHCNDSVSFTDGRISVNNFHIYDPDNNILTVNGGIDYSNPSDLLLNLNLRSNLITVLHSKSKGSNPYGKLITAINGTITGRKGTVTINATAQTRPGSEITFPVDNKLSSTEQDYIHFISPYVNHNETVVSKNNIANIPTISLALTITPDLSLHVPMDFNQLGVDIHATGNGNLQLHTGIGNGTNLVGNYEFTSGTLVLSMLSLIEKNFTIEPGSSLLFPGSLNRTQFDVSAVYALRANLSSLTGTETESQRNIPVQSIINLVGNLQNPNITFDIRLPNVDATTSEEVFTYIDRSNQRDMLNQTISLLAMGQFYSNANSSQLASSATTSGYSAMAKSVSSIMSQMIKIVDIDIDYTAATDLTTEQFDIGISKSWERFYFESTLGYGGESRNLNSNADEHAVNNLVGDILVGYRLNPRLHLFVFNRSNTNDYTRVELPYKQGIGLKFTRDFNRWGDLFHRTKQP